MLSHITFRWLLVAVFVAACGCGAQVDRHPVQVALESKYLKDSDGWYVARVSQLSEKSFSKDNRWVTSSRVEVVLKPREDAVLLVKAIPGELAIVRNVDPSIVTFEASSLTYNDGITDSEEVDIPHKSWNSNLYSRATLAANYAQVITEGEPDFDETIAQLKNEVSELPTLRQELLQSRASFEAIAASLKEQINTITKEQGALQVLDKEQVMADIRTAVADSLERQLALLSEDRERALKGLKGNNSELMAPVAAEIEATFESRRAELELEHAELLKEKLAHTESIYFGNPSQALTEKMKIAKENFLKAVKALNNLEKREALIVSFLEGLNDSSDA